MTVAYPNTNPLGAKPKGLKLSYSRVALCQTCVSDLQEVFGDNSWTWFLPVSTSIGDGLTYPTRISVSNMEAATSSYQSIASRNGNGDVDVEAASLHQNGHVSSHQGQKTTEVVLDSKDRVKIKVRGE